MEAPRAHAARSAGASAVCLPTSSGRGWGQPFRFRGLALCVFVPLWRAAFLSSMNTFNPGLSVRLMWFRICRLESRRTRKAGRSRGQSAHDRRLSFPPPSGVSRHVAPAVRMLQMHPTRLSRARVSVRQPSQPATAPLFESCSVRKRALFFAHDGAPRGAWCSGHRLARAEWLRRRSVHLVRPACRPAPTHSRARASSAPF